MTKYLAVTLTVLMLFGCGLAKPSPNVVVKEYILGYELDREMIDVNKTWDDDDNMCWAAAWINMIAFAADLSQHEADIGYRDMVQNFDNEGGNLWQAAEWSCGEVGLESNPDCPFYLLLSMREADWGFTSKLTWLLSRLDGGAVGAIAYEYDVPKDQQKEGEPTTLNHIITVYGYQIMEDGSLRLIVVDSDDRAARLFPAYVRVDDDGTEWVYAYRWNHVIGVYAFEIIAN
jgi:hypothetical protein